MGGNVKAAMLSGVNTERLYFLTFVNMGVLAALAGLIVAARLNVATPKLATVLSWMLLPLCLSVVHLPPVVSGRSLAP
jgi:putative multiple sugar transport system permease protein